MAPGVLVALQRSGFAEYQSPENERLKGRQLRVGGSQLHLTNWYPQTTVKRWSTRR